jgi:hypothetical protein
LLLVGAVIAWWGWERGAYFDVVLLPGAIILLALAAVLLLFAPWPGSFRGEALLALVALLALATWTLASGLWSPTPDVAVADAQRVLAYAVAFGLGIWLCVLLGPRMKLALMPLAGGVAAVALATLIALWVSDNAAELFETDATLRYPLGYRNAVAAFFLAGLWPTIALAASRDLDWRLRGALLGAATLALELAILAQSRGSAFAAVIAAAVLVAAYPGRLRILAWLALAAVPAALALPWLLDVFQTRGGNTSASLPPLRTACGAIAITVALAVAAGAMAARRDPLIALSPGAEHLLRRGLLGGLAAILLVGVVGLARSDGGPVGFVSRHADELTAGTPDPSEQSSRFGLDLSSHRGDLWRVALDGFAADPLIGGGAGSFRSDYLLDRNATTVEPEDPHSVELLMASELGLPGLALFGTFAVAAALAALRARRLGPSAAALAAAALAAGTYWFLHASVEWFWHYPALTMPIAFALGAAAAPPLMRPAAGADRRLRTGLAAVAIGVAVVMVPFFLSDRYTNEALRTWRGDLNGAYSDLDRAADLNPLSDRPPVAEAVIAESVGDRQRALGALAEAEDRRPQDWTIPYLEARVLAPIDPAGARAALERADALNPLGPQIDALQGEIDRFPSSK